MRTRNARLAAIRSLFRYAALRHPEHAAIIERVLAIPPKRFDRRLVTFLTEAEIDALLAAPDRSTWTGRRDTTLFGLAAQTGLRASELIGLSCADVHLGTGAHVSCNGKGRKQRITPLTSGIVAVLRVWLAERGGQPTDPLFPTGPDAPSAATRSNTGSPNTSQTPGRLSVAGTKDESPCMCCGIPPPCDCCSAGIDTSVIALWLGHEQVETTQIYLHADLEIKERALARTAPTTTQTRPLPTDRQTSRLPGGALIMPTPSTAIPARNNGLPAYFGIIRTSA